jgi:hypothetical protein
MAVPTNSTSSTGGGFRALTRELARLSRADVELTWADCRATRPAADCIALAQHMDLRAGAAASSEIRKDCGARGKRDPLMLGH